MHKINLWPLLTEISNHECGTFISRTVNVLSKRYISHMCIHVLELSCIVIRETESGIQSIHSECIFATCVSCMYDVVTKLKASIISRVQREAVRQK